MSSKTLLFVFVLCIAQTILCGPLKVKSPEVLKLVNDIELQRNNVEMQLKLLELNSKTAIKGASYAAKLEVKQFEAVVKTVKDVTCSVVARTSLKAAEQAQGDLKLCNSKDGTKLLKTQITTFLKTLQSQAHAIEGYCSLMHTEESEVELCTATAIAAIREQLENTVNFTTSSVEGLSKNEEECIGNAVQKVKDAVSEGTANIDSCVNPTTPKEESEESNESESENSGSDESGEQSATTAAQEGGEGPVEEGSEAPVEEGEGPVEGSEAPVEGTEAAVEGTEAAEEGGEGPADGSERPVEGNEAEGEAPAEGETPEESEAPAEGEAAAEGEAPAAEGEATVEEEVGGLVTEGAAQEGSGNAENNVGEGEVEEGENAQEPTEAAAQENEEEAGNQQEGGEPAAEGGENVQEGDEQQGAATEGSQKPQEPVETAPEESENPQEPR